MTRSGTITRWLHQTWAVTVAECQRLLSAPTWAVLLALWTAVCALFAQVVVTHAGHQALPAGETPMAAFFRFFPGLLPLLLVVFVPQLAMDAIAGRRERGRLEHLQLSGLAPGALVVGSFIALCAVISVLALPIGVFHLALGASDFGATCAAIIVILLQASALAALALAIGAWTPGRLSAALCAGAAGLGWWIADVFAPAVHGTEAMAEQWFVALGLSQAIHDAAGGGIAVRHVLALIGLNLTLLALARCALRWRQQPPVLLATAAALIVLAIGALGHITRIERTVDWAAIPPLQTATSEAIEKLSEDSPVEATLIVSAAMANDPIDGPIVSQLRRKLLAASTAGMHWHMLDPERSPRSVAELRDRHRISDDGLAHPVLIISHLDRAQVLTLDSIAEVQEIDGRRELIGLSIEPAIASACQRLQGALPHVYWMATTQTRPPAIDAPHQRATCVGAWRRTVAAQGCAVHELTQWTDITQAPVELIIIPGLHADIPEAGIQALRQHLQRGGHLLLALDGDSDADLSATAALCADYGLGWTGSRILADSNGSAVRATPIATDGPAAFLVRHGLTSVLPNVMALNANQGQRGIGSIGTWLPIPAGSIVRTPVGDGILDTPHPAMLSSRATHSDDQAGNIILFGSVQAFADGDLHQAGNRELASGLVHWLLRDNEYQPSATGFTEVEQLTLSPTRRALTRWGAGLAVPLLALAFGGGVWWWRRRA